MRQISKLDAIKTLVRDYARGRKISQASVNDWKRCAFALGIEKKDLFDLLEISEIYCKNNNITI